MNKENVIQAILDSNDRYNAATVEQRRVMVAHDVLALMRAEKIVPAYSAGYVSGDDGHTPLDDDMPQCRVCGIGGEIVASALRQHTACRRQDEYGYKGKTPFTTTMLEVIEYFFEHTLPDTIEEEFPHLLPVFQSITDGILYSRTDTDADVRFARIWSWVACCTRGRDFTKPNWDKDLPHE